MSLLFIVTFLSTSLLNLPKAHASLQSATVSVPNDYSFTSGTGNNVSYGRGDNQTVGISDLSGTTAPDWDKYKVPITINNTANSGAVTNNNITFTLNTQSLISAGKMQSDCGDLRFLDSDGSNLRIMNIANCNTTTSTITLLIPSIPAASSKTITMYYGSPTVQTTESVPLSSGSFTDSLVSGSPSDADFNGDSTYNSPGGYAELTRNISGTNGNMFYNVAPATNYDVSFQLKAGGGTGADSLWWQTYCNAQPVTEHDSCGGYIVAYDEYSQDIILQYDGQTLASMPETNINNNTWHNAEIKKIGNEFQVYYDGVKVIDYTDSTRTIVGDIMGFGSRNGGSNDNHLIRNITISYGVTTPTNTPSVNLGSETTITPSYNSTTQTPTWKSKDIDFGNFGDWGDTTNSSTAMTFSYHMSSANEELKLSLSDDDGDSWTQVADLTSGSSFSLTKAQMINTYHFSGGEYMEAKVSLATTDNTTPTFSI
ncbi:MAG: DUF2341 domain-containing protein [Candidatus Saccharibacteria bacterium]